MLKHAPCTDEAIWSKLPDEERRAIVRYPTTVTALCYAAGNRGGEPGRACVRDLSMFGVGLILEQRLDPNALLEVDLVRAAWGVVRSVLARVVHVERLESSWLVGCAFTSELSDQELHLFRAERVVPARPDSRRWVRFPCNVETVCYTNETMPGERTPAQIIDISPGGLGLLLPCAFSQGTLLHFEMPGLPGEPIRRRLVRVVRAREQAKGDWFLGCEFVLQLSDWDLQDLLS